MTHSPASIHEPSRPMRADARRNYDRLVSAAQEVFTEQGIGASLEEIAQRAGVGTGTLYRHFPTREALQMAVMDSAFCAQHEYALELLEQEDRAGAIEAYIRYWISNTAVYKGLAAEVMKSAIENDQMPVQASCMFAKPDFAEIVRRAHDSGAIHPDLTETDIWRLLHGVAMAVKESDIDRDSALRMVEIILKGIRSDR